MKKRNEVTIPSMEELSSDYAAALAKREEMRQALRSIDEQGAALREQHAEAQQGDRADELLSAGNVAEALEAAPAESLKRQLEALTAKRATVAEALRRAGATVEQEERKAARKVGDAVRADWDRLLARQAAAVAELANAIDEYHSLQDRLPGGRAGACGLPEVALFGVVGNKLGASVRRMVESGYLDASAVGDRWLK